MSNGTLGISRCARLVFIERRSGAVSFSEAPRIVPFHGVSHFARPLLRRESTPTSLDDLRARTSSSRGENLPLSTKRKEHVAMGVDVEVLSPGDGNYAGFVFLGTRRITSFSLLSGEPLSRFAFSNSLSRLRARVHARARAMPRARRSENFRVSLLTSSRLAFVSRSEMPRASVCRCCNVPYWK